jgi:tetratricopeptide (TPR) repeat protein
MPMSPQAQVILYTWVTFARAYRGNDAWFAREEAGFAALAPRADSMRAHVGFLYALFDRKAEARGCYTPLLRTELLDGEHHDNWLMNFALVAEAASTCGDVEAARMLYPRLLPHRGLNVSHYEWLIYFGSCEHFLGLLAEQLGQSAAAREHFEVALEYNTKLGDRPAQARTLVAYARALSRSGADAGVTAGAARERAGELLRVATALAAELGMRAVLREARALSS